MVHNRNVHILSMAVMRNLVLGVLNQDFFFKLERG